MNKYFCPFLEMFCSLFKHIAQLGSHFAQAVVYFAHFQVLPGKGVFWCGIWVFFVNLHIPKSCVWLLSKKHGFGVACWAKWDPVWTNCYPSGQLERAKVLSNWKKKFNPKIQSKNSGRAQLREKENMPRCQHDIFSYIKMHFSYVKSNILCR